MTHQFKDNYTIQYKIPEDNLFKLSAAIPEYKTIITIPKDGGFSIHYEKKFSWWKKFWFRFIGWGVEEHD